MERIVKKVKIKSSQGLHARPAAVFVKAANKYLSDIMIKKDDEIIDAKSIINILSLALEPETEIELIIEGEDSAEALKELEKILEEDNE